MGHSDPQAPSRRRIHLIGNAHIDPVWLWRWTEGYEEVRATFRSALDRMDEYPEFIFTMNQVVFLAWVAEHDPELFERIRQRVEEGRWEIVGGMWVEPNCNLPAGESFVRQTLYAQHYLMAQFGRPATVGLNADPFGHNAMLPQILAKSGMDSYLFLRPQAHEMTLPAGAFWWVAPDGSRVLASRIPNEYCTPGDEITYQVAKSLAQLPSTDRALVCFYGVGNHGGGPTRANIESIRELARRDGTPPMAPATARGYFDEAARDEVLEEFSGELQMHAVGCYSAMSEIKRNNRRCENVLRSAEKWATVAGTLAPLPDATPELAHGWKQLLFNQFHDILPGTALPSAFVDARDMHGEAAAVAGRVANRSIQSISRQIGIPFEPDSVPVVVFNPHGFPVRQVLELEFGGLAGPLRVCDERGEWVPTQVIRSESLTPGRCRLAFLGSVPALGYRQYRVRKTGSAVVPAGPAAPVPESFVLQNEHLMAVVDPASGWLSSLVSAETGIDLLAGVSSAHAVVLHDDTDTWSHGIRSYRDVVGTFAVQRIDRTEHGPARQAVRVISRFGSSRLIEEIRLDAGSRHLEVAVTLDWREQCTALKLRVPTGIRSPVATHEIPYGHLVRPALGQEVPTLNWVDIAGVDAVSGSPCGLGVLNDGKYSCDVNGADVGLMAVRSPAFAWHDPADLDSDEPYHYQDQGIQHFTYRLLPHGGDWRAAGLPAAGAVLNEPLTVQMECAHEGPLPPAQSFASVRQAGPNPSSVMMSVLKSPEIPDGGAGVIVLRAYETSGAPTAVEIDLPFLGRTVAAEFGACEIKTLLVPVDPSAPVVTADLLERPQTSVP